MSRSLLSISSIQLQKDNYSNKLVQAEQSAMLKELLSRNPNGNSSDQAEQSAMLKELLSREQCCDKLLTNFANLQKRLEYLISLEEGEVCGCLIDLNKKKTELIQIMNDYLTQKVTRVDTTDKLTTLELTIS